MQCRRVPGILVAAALAGAPRWPVRRAGRCATLAGAPRWPVRCVEWWVALAGWSWTGMLAGMIWMRFMSCADVAAGRGFIGARYAKLRDLCLPAAEGADKR